MATMIQPVDAVKKGFELLQAHALTVVAAALGPTLVTIPITVVIQVVAFVAAMVLGNSLGGLVAMVVGLIGLVLEVGVAFWMAPTAATLMLSVIDGRPGDWKAYLTRHPRMVPYFLALLVWGVSVTIGMFLLVLPGIYMALAGIFVPYIAADREVGPVDALKQSMALANANMVPIVILGLVIAVLNFVGAIPMGLGLLVTMPVSMAAVALAYRSLAPAEGAARPKGKRPGSRPLPREAS